MNKVVPVYSAQGAMEKVLLCYRFPKALPITQAELAFADIINALEDTVVYIVVIYSRDTEFPVMENMSVSKGRLKFIVINQDELGVKYMESTTWMQDVVNVVRYEGEDARGIRLVLCCEGFNEVFREYILNGLDDIQLPPIQTVNKWDGGNVLLGQFKDIKYLIIGRKADNALSEELKDVYGVDSVIYADPVYSERYKNIFFHLDMYLTINGPFPGAWFNKEIIFIADPVNIQSEDLQRTIQTIRQNIGEGGRNSDIEFEFVPLPLVLVDPDNFYVLSYNNCLIENYITSEGRVMNAYFPSYKRDVEDYIDQMYDNGIVLPSIKSFARKQAEFFDLEVVLQQDHEKLAAENVSEKAVAEYVKKVFRLTIKKIEASIESRFKEYGFSKVRFVNAKFRDFADERGSLHCMVKVLQRSEQ